MDVSPPVSDDESGAEPGGRLSDRAYRAVLEALLTRVDTLVIGGAMANTFLAAQGREMGRSLVEEDKLPLARTILQRADERGVSLLLPIDLVVAPSTDASSGRTVPVTEVGADEMALDVGPDSVERFAEATKGARAVFWNGPMGLFENEPFSHGTVGVAEAIAAAPGFTVVGGGDSVAAVQRANMADRFDHVSTGGGASLELLEGRKLPGVEALRG